MTFRDDTGRVRSGWVIVAFTLVAVAVAGLVQGLIMGLHLQPEYSLDDPRLAFSTWGNFFSGAFATLVAWRLGQDAGLKRSYLFWVGAAVGAALVTLTVLIGAAASGTVAFAACSHRTLAGLEQLVTVGPTAVGEELWMRGAALRALARGTHPLFAVAGTGLVFGALHLMNPEATLVAALNVALVGIWFGAIAWRAQSIWPAIGAHLAWNWFEGFVWGQNVSGIQAGCALFTANAREPFWGGGSFGPEASGLTALLLAGACAVTLASRRFSGDSESARRP